MNFKSSGKLKAVTFSYDDGVTQDIKLIELLNKYNLKSTFNLNSMLLNKNGIIVRDGKRIAHYKIHAEDINSVYAGHEIAAHTLTHENLTSLDKNEILKQVELDRLNLSDIAGYEVLGMAYPCGGVNNDNRVAKIIREGTGIKYSRTITCNNSFELQSNLYRFNPTAFHLDFENLMELGENFINSKADKPQIFYIWGHSFELDFQPDYLIRLEEFFKLIANKSDIFYGTNKEVLL